jgi:ectoine hydroxylase-related dioxygenase (phytanoyl-CoA dioxygenase family)
MPSAMGNLAKFNESVHSADLLRAVEGNGFAVVPSCLNDEIVQRLGSELSDASYGLRNLLAVSTVREVATSAPVRSLVEAVLGKNCFAVRGTFFNKTQESNWKVAWHQDLTIMVQERREVAGFGPWTVKAGIQHVQPSVEVLGRILAVRLHLDESGEENGPLRVIPGSHTRGRFSAQEVAEWSRRGNLTCTIPRGGALLMRPLILHASSACLVPKSRRVIHLEFCADELPDGLMWYDRVG